MMTPYKYYSPVTDVTFRTVFGENIDLAASRHRNCLPTPTSPRLSIIHLHFF